MYMRSTLPAAAICIAMALGASGTAQAAANVTPQGARATTSPGISEPASAPIILAQNRQFRGNAARGASRPAIRGGGGAVRQFRGGGQQFRAARPAFRGGGQQFRATRPALRAAPRQVFRGGAVGARRPVINRRAASYPRFRARRAGYNYYYNGWWYPYRWWLPAAAVGIGVGAAPIYGDACSTYHIRCGRRYGYYTYNYEVCMRDYYGCY